MTMTTKSQAGFTLVEMIVAIVITGIAAAMVSFFIRTPILSYFDALHRAELADMADTAVRRMSRDVHLALPNSIRTPNQSCFEYLPTSTGGRYRADVPGNPLNFSAATTTFDVLGGMTPIPASNDRVVVYNLGIPGADAYAGDNAATVAGATAASVTLSAAKLFPFASPGNRFHVIPHDELGVFYVCAGAGIDASGDGTGTLYRYANYGINSATPTACPTIPSGTPVLARNLSSCSFSYASGITERSGLISMRLAITRNSETVTLYHEVHVNNVP